MVHREDAGRSLCHEDLRERVDGRGAARSALDSGGHLETQQREPRRRQGRGQRGLFKKKIIKKIIKKRRPRRRL